MTTEYKCYKNNPRLKAANVDMDITKAQLKEIIKCGNDPLYFARNYVKIVNVDLGLIQFEPRDYQEEMIATFQNNRFTICKMARQTGKTTVTGTYILWHILFQPDQAAAILANKQSLAIEIMDRLKLAYEHLPWFLQQGVLRWNKKGITLENGSTCIAGSTSSTSIRGGTYNLIFLDEFAHIKGKLGEEFFESVYPTIASGKTTKVIIVSTPKGMNLFHKLWVDSENGENSYARIDVHWSQVPHYDAEWKKETIANTSQRQFDQEFECLFLGSANTLILGHKLRSMAYMKPIRELTTPHTEDKVQIYFEPEPKRVYVATVDVSEGVGLDAASISVFDVTEFPYQQVACYASKHISELLLPDVIRAVAVFYNDAMVLIENNCGREVANTLEIDLEYENIVNVSTDKRLGQIAGGGYGKKTQNGVKMSKSVKRIGCTTLKTLLEDDKLLIHDYETLFELQNFVETKGSYSADGEGHDDRVITMVLFAWLSIQEYFKEVSDLDVRAKMLAERAKQAEQEVLPFFAGNHDENMQPYRDPEGTIWTPVEDIGDHSHAFDDGWGEFRN